VGEHCYPRAGSTFRPQRGYVHNSALGRVNSAQRGAFIRRGRRAGGRSRPNADFDRAIVYSALSEAPA